MEEIIVRPAAPGDLDAVWALVRRAVQKMREEGSEQWGEDYPTRADYEEDLRRGRLAAAVSAQGQVLGCACITDAPETAYAGVPWAVEGPALVVHRVAVDPALQRGGVASALLTYAEDWARARGIPVFHADTYCKNRKMQALFRKRGFVQRGEIHLPGRSLPFPAFEKLL